MPKLVSIMIPTYNAANTIRQTLESILQQSYANMEIVIIDNASTDDTVQILKQFNDPRLTIVVNDKNIGAEGNFNKCIELAKGDYIAIYHADDIYEKNIVESEVCFLDDHPEVGAVLTEGYIINENNQKTGELSIPQKLFNTSSVYELKNVLPILLEYGNSFLICPTAMVRSKIYKNIIQKWRQDLFGSAADVDVWLRILEEYPIGIINKPLINYRHSTTHWTYNYNKLRTKRDDGLNVYDFYIDKHKAWLSEKDMLNYEFINRKDEIKRAIHYSLQYENNQAKQLLVTLLNMNALKQGIKSIQKLKIYLAGIALFSAINIGLGYPTAKILKKFY